MRQIIITIFLCLSIILSFEVYTLTVLAHLWSVSIGAFINLWVSIFALYANRQKRQLFSILCAIWTSIYILWNIFLIWVFVDKKDIPEGKFFNPASNILTFGIGFRNSFWADYGHGCKTNDSYFNSNKSHPRPNYIPFNGYLASAWIIEVIHFGLCIFIGIIFIILTIADFRRTYMTNKQSKSNVHLQFLRMSEIDDCGPALQTRLTMDGRSGGDLNSVGGNHVSLTRNHLIFDSIDVGGVGDGGSGGGVVYNKRYPERAPSTFFPGDSSMRRNKALEEESSFPLPSTPQQSSSRQLTESLNRHNLIMTNEENHQNRPPLLSSSLSSPQPPTITTTTAIEADERGIVETQHAKRDRRRIPLYCEPWDKKRFPIPMQPIKQNSDDMDESRPLSSITSEQLNTHHVKPVIYHNLSMGRPAVGHDRLMSPRSGGGGGGQEERIQHPNSFSSSFH